MIKFYLKELLSEKDMKKYQLYKLTNIDNNTLAKIYDNKAKQIRLETLDKICDALGCDLSDLIKKE
jgi:putative transcriptional regulator